MPGSTPGIKFILRALRHRNYRLFFAGQGISLIGTWMQSIAVSWLVYRLTNSAFLLGLVGFTSQFPTFILAPFAGVLADRFNRKRILMITQTLAMLQAFLLAFLSFSGNILVWHVVALSIFLGLVNGFDIPVRQTFVVDIIEDRGDLSNAIALNSLMFNGARLVGPTVAGIIIAAAGEKACFLINGISFLAVIFALWMMKIKPFSIQGKKSRIWENLKEGFVYVFNSVPIRSTLILITLISLMGMAYAVLMPVFVKDILKGDARTLGFLMAAVGLGSLIGALFLAMRKSERGLEKIIPIATVIFGFGLVAFALSRVLWLSLFLILIVGFGLIVQVASSNTLLQSITHDDKRGRVMSFYTMAFMGMAPLGSLLAGLLASRLGVTNTLLISGFSCVAGLLFFAGRFKYPLSLRQ